MSSEKIYKKLLKKMLTIEILGYNLYNILASKTHDENLESIYEKLAIGEQHTAQYIKQQLSNKHAPNKPIIALAWLIFKMLSEKQLSFILKNTLEKRIYSKWFKMYNNKNEEFWRILLEHENIQHELLIHFWSKKGGMYGQRKYF